MHSIKRLKDPFCSLSHWIGAGLSLAALIVLLYQANGSILASVAFLIYGLSLLTLYTSSALYHSLQVSPHATRKLQRLDHSAIFVLIAGTYTPVCLIPLKGAWGYSLLAAQCALLIVGISISLARRAPEWPRFVLYLLMGWMVLAALGPLRAVMPPAGFLWLLAGGIAYSVGAAVFATDKPHLWPGKFSAHDLWHVFVLAGSACHFVVMLRFVAPAV